MLDFIKNLFHRRKPPLTLDQKLRPDNIQQQAIDITDAMWSTYRFEYLKRRKPQKFIRMKPRRLKKQFPYNGWYNLKPNKVYEWFADLINYWTVMSFPNESISSIHHTLELNHSNNFYELTIHESLYRDLKGFLLQRQPKAFNYPACFYDPSHGRIILPGDEQHFLLPESDMFDSVKYNNNTEWNKFLTYVRKQHGLKSLSMN